MVKQIFLSDVINSNNIFKVFNLETLIYYYQLFTLINSILDIILVKTKTTSKNINTLTIKHYRGKFID